MKNVGISIAIVVAAVAIGAGIIFALQKPNLATQPSQAARLANPPIEIDVAGYEEEVAQMVNAFRKNPSARAAEDAYATLLGLRVPGEYKDLHLDLVLYFNAQTSSQQVELETLEAAAAQVGWL